MLVLFTIIYHKYTDIDMYYYPFDIIHVAMPVLFNSNIGMVVLGSVSTLMFMHVCVRWV